MKILITGAFGSLGTATLELLTKAQKNYEITCLVTDKRKARRKARKYSNQIEVIFGDIRNKEQLEEVVTKKDIVLHFAAIVPPRFQYEPLEYSKEVNVDGTKNILEAITKKNPQAKLLYPSSVAVFGDVRKKGKCILTPDDPTNPNKDDIYAQQKVQAEELIQKSNISWSIFRFGFMPNVDSLEFDPMMFDVPLDTNMEIIDVRDAAKAIVHALDKEEIWGKILHLAGGVCCRLTYKEFVTGMLETMGIGSLPDEAFTTNDFHCGFMDSDYSQELLQYQTRSYQDLLQEMGSKAKGLAFLAQVFRPIVKWFLLKKSPYYKKN